MGLLPSCIADQDIQTVQAINCAGNQFPTEFLIL